MKQTILVIGSMTYAIKAKKVLARAGIPAQTVKATKNASGCVYGVAVPYPATFEARMILGASGITCEIQGS